jgi:hypothetical protein
MFKWPWKRERKIAFIDGDQSLPDVLRAYQKHVANTNTETHLVRLMTQNSGRNVEPVILRTLENVNKIYLQGFTTGKEVTDKFIGAYIQKAINDGYTHITVVSSDYDFIDIFKMAAIVDKDASKLTFRMVIPNAKGRVRELPDQLLNIEIIK